MLVEGYPKQGAGHLLHTGYGLQLLEEFCGQTLTFLVTSGKLSLKEGDQSIFVLINNNIYVAMYTVKCSSVLHPCRAFSLVCY